MACDANSILADAAPKGLFSLDDRTILLGIIGSLNTAAGSPTANATLASAASYGLGKIDDQSLLAVLATYLSQQAATNLQTAINSASTNGLLNLDNHSVFVGILDVVMGASTLTQVISIATAKGFQSLQDRQLVESIAQLTIKSASTLQTLLNDAETGGFFKVSHATLVAVILQLYCQTMSSVPPAAPVATAGSNPATTQFQANWNASAGATSYRLDVSTSNVFASFVAGYNDLNVGNVLNATVTGLSGNTTYYYRVRAVNASGTSANSNTISLDTCPQAPTGLLINSASSNQNTAMSWSQGSAPTTNEIWRSTDSGATYALFDTVAGATTFYADASTIPSGGEYYYKIRACNATCCSSFTDPAGVFNGLDRTVNTGTVTYSFPFLQMVYGTMLIGNEASLVTFSVPQLHTVKTDVVLINLASLTTIDFTLLSLVGGGCGVFDSPSIASVSFPAVVTVGGFFGAARNAGLVNFSAPLVATIGADLQIYLTPVLGAVSLASLTTVGTGMSGANSGITSFTAAALTTLSTGNIDFQSCSNLVTFSVPNLIIADGFQINFDSSGLDDTSVNGILAVGVASNTSASDYELANGTNASPSGQGIVDKGTLIANGNTVNTN
jgi:hypothetical protein